jgi:hypothetical protein
MSSWRNIIQDELGRCVDVLRPSNQIEAERVDETGRVVGGYGIGTAWEASPSSADSAEQGRAR